MTEMITVAICPQCGGYTAVVTNEYMTSEDRALLQRAATDGDTIEEMPRGLLSRLPVCHGHAVENGDLFGGGE